MNNAISRPLILAMGLAFPASHIVLGIFNLDMLLSPWPALLAMGICVALMVVVTMPASDRGLSRRNAVITVAGTALMDVLVQSVLPTGIHPGYAAWHCGAIQMLLVTVALRKQIGLAWLGIGIFSVLDFSGSMLHRLSPVDGLALVVTPLMWIGIAHAVSRVFGRCDVLVRNYEDQEKRSAARIAREHARWLSQNDWVTELEHATKPTLTKVATGNLDASDRADCGYLQDELRDQVRGRVLATPPVLKSARAARERGVAVEIFDDREAALPDAVQQEALAQLIGALDRAESGFVKARALPRGQEIAVTILAYDENTPDDEFYLEVREQPEGADGARVVH
ncbi:hypothetical protein [Arthrobacter sp. 2MCAF14]|uniref:hypothetical protein n=1 Tax=Arthrobacter sp. 2MCAF14 TaxID=3232982 RepID=UPI003F9139C3